MYERILGIIQGTTIVHPYYGGRPNRPWDKVEYVGISMDRRDKWEILSKGNRKEAHSYRQSQSGGWG